jgi:hypothetical protein
MQSRRDSAGRVRCGTSMSAGRFMPAGRAITLACAGLDVRAGCDDARVRRTCIALARAQSSGRARQTGQSKSPRPDHRRDGAIGKKPNRRTVLAETGARAYPRTIGSYSTPASALVANPVSPRQERPPLPHLRGGPADDLETASVSVSPAPERCRFRHLADAAGDRMPAGSPARGPRALTRRGPAPMIRWCAAVRTATRKNDVHMPNPCNRWPCAVSRLQLTGTKCTLT